MIKEIKKNYDSDYRLNVCCLVYQNNRFLLLQSLDWPENWWKFPQGGVESGESLEKTALRELFEELGCDKFRIAGVSTVQNKYDWSEDSRRLASYRWRGQQQYFLVVEFLGHDSDLNLNRREFRAYRWVNLSELADLINRSDSDFYNYKNSIFKVLREFELS